MTELADLAKLEESAKLAEFVEAETEFVEVEELAEFGKQVSVDA